MNFLWRYCFFFSLSPKDDTDQIIQAASNWWRNINKKCIQNVVNVDCEKQNGKKWTDFIAFRSSKVTETPLYRCSIVHHMEACAWWHFFCRDQFPPLSVFLLRSCCERHGHGNPIEERIGFQKNNISVDWNAEQKASTFCASGWIH